MKNGTMMLVPKLSTDDLDFSSSGAGTSGMEP